MSRVVAPPKSPPDLIAAAATAWAAVHKAEARAGVKIENLERLQDIKAAADLWHRVWERDGEPPVTSDMLRALSHAENYLSGAFVDGLLVAALIGFYGAEHGAFYLHSHILGVESTTRTRGVGFAVKQHQRAWALDRGITQIKWTFDPLVRANGYFNISKLAAEGVGYLEDFYGAMPDTINSGDQSDRIFVSWDLLSPRVERAAAGHPDELDLAAALRDGAVVALSMGDDGGPVPGVDGDGYLVCQTPLDIVGLRRQNPTLATSWRPAVRAVMGGAFDRGLALRGMNRAGWYLLAR